MGEIISNLPQSLTHFQTMWSRVAVVLLSAASCHAGLLGAGTGEGSCPAAPFRAGAVKWVGGCPSTHPCCSEYGFCQIEENWRAGVFRDCNGVSNGTPLPPDAIAAENAAAARGDTSAAAILAVPAGGNTASFVGAAGVIGAGPAAVAARGFGGFGAAGGAGALGAAGGFGGAGGAGGFGGFGVAGGAGGFGAAGGAGGFGGAGAVYASGAPFAYAGGAPAAGYGIVNGAYPA